MWVPLGLYYQSTAASRNEMLLLLLTATLLQICAGSSQPEVEIHQGRLQGVVQQTIHGRKFNAFLGIPYAQPPIGELRFKEAKPSKPWLGVWNATRKGEDCLQTVWFVKNPAYDVVGSEDCLFVNVFTPKLPSDQGSKPLDVLVYIHGGGFQYLSAATYGPEFILDRDVVYVTFNYRLGILGFLSLGDDVVPGNNGLKDQNLALKWVKQNIAAFGGDPKRITISGMSAGGASVHYHLLSKKAEGLFQKAIITSGAVSNPWALSVNVPQKSLAVAASIGCPTEATVVLKCLQERPAAEILRANLKLKTIFDLPISPIGPSIEKSGPSAYIDKHAYEIIGNGEAIDVPILWSINSDEGMDPGMGLIGEASKILDENWDALMPHILDLNGTVDPKRQLQIVHQLKEHYLGGMKINDQAGQFIQMIGDRYFYNGIHESVKLHAKYNKSPVWMYRFSLRASVRISDAFGNDKIYKGGACHGDDVHYVLKTSYAPVDKTPRDIEIIKYMTGIWMDFIQGKLKWKDVKAGLPDLTVLDIVSSNHKENQVKTVERTPGQELWLSFDLSEKIIKKDEL